MNIFETLLNFELWGNTGLNYAVFVLVFILTAILIKMIQVVALSNLEKLAKKTKNDLDDAIILSFKDIKPSFYYIVSLYAGITFLHISEIAGNIATGLLILVVFYQIIKAFENFIIHMTENENVEKRLNKNIAQNISTLIKIALWTFALLMILSNWGVNITSLIAGLGIGGIAIALALQKILGDIFSSFSIFIDKPFEVGDFIVIGSDMGVVKKIGIKTTRVTTLQGEELVVANQELTNERVRNFKKMEKRRVVFPFGVLYETPQKKLEKIPDMVKEIIKKQEGTEVDRVHFKEFGDFSLNFEVVYYINTNDYTKYMDVQQAINFGINEEFQKEGIEFAYPTQKLYLNK